MNDDCACHMLPEGERPCAVCERSARRRAMDELFSSATGLFRRIDDSAPQPLIVIGCADNVPSIQTEYQTPRPSVRLEEEAVAKPIEPTPTLYGQDAQRVLESLKNVAPSDELARRQEAARKFTELVTSGLAAGLEPSTWRDIEDWNRSHPVSVVDASPCEPPSTLAADVRSKMDVIVARMRADRNEPQATTSLGTGLDEATKAKRRGTLGASEVAAVLGLHPYATPHDVWMHKVLGREIEETEEMSLGTMMEPAILDIYRHRYGATLRKGHYVRGAEDWMSATPDAWIEGGGLVEAKLAGIRTVRMYGPGDRDGFECDEAPAHYVCQALWQMEITGEPFVHLAVLMGTEFRRFTIRRNEHVQRAMVDRAREWWQRHVVSEVPPPVDGSESATEMLKRLYPRSGGPRVRAGHDLQQLAVDLIAARATLETAATAESLAVQRMKEALADAAGAWGDGWDLRYLTTSNGRRPFVFRTL